MTLFIRLAEQCDWVATGPETLAGFGTIETVAKDLREVSWQGDIVALVPGEKVLLTTAIVPSRQTRHITQALPYAVEEKLAVDIEMCHIALGGKNKSGEFVVCINALEDMRRHLTQLKGVGLEPTIMTVDTLLSPSGQKTCITIEGERAHIRRVDRTGFCAPVKQLAMVVGLINESDDIALHIPDKKIDQLSMEIAQIETKSSVTLHAEKEDGLKLLVENYRGDELNLLQGEFQVTTEKEGNKGVWRTASIIAGCTLFLYLSLLLAQGAFLDYAADQYSDEISALYRDVFPGDNNIRDLRRRWSARLSGMPEAANFLQILGDTVAHLPGSEIVVNNINYNKSRGDLVMQVATSRSEKLVDFVDTLNKVGLNAEISTISQQTDLVRGSLKIKLFGEGG
ncbi:MAG: hypothetical protein CMP95_07525 [Gammaproteobacteria bacterium]|nr:hypothetical protein [Gammaproteobacteria bacterium]OUV67865.1 MAG: hypothetical protein CBC93_03870 [Gammaproteobacteria bacterium TMED133]